MKINVLHERRGLADTGHVRLTTLEPGLMTFDYAPPPAQSAEEFRKSFSDEFCRTLGAQMEYGSK